MFLIAAILNGHRVSFVLGDTAVSLIVTRYGGFVNNSEFLVRILQNRGFMF